MFWIVGQQRLVAADSGVVVDVTGLGQAHNGMNKQVGLKLLDCPQGKLIMRPMHGVAGAAELVTEISRSQT